MKKGKAPGPSGVVTEILKKAFSDVCSKMIVDLTNSIIRDNTMQGRIQSFLGTPFFEPTGRHFSLQTP